MNLNRKQLIALEDIDETSTKPEHTQAVGERETKESFWPLNRLDNLSVYIYAGGNDCGIGYVELSSKRLSTLNFQKKDRNPMWNLVHYSAFTPYKYKSIQNETLRKHF